MFSISKKIILAQFLIYYFTTQFCFAQENTISKQTNETEIIYSENNSYVPSFRSGHHLSLFLTTEYANWRLIQDKTDIFSEVINPINERNFNFGFYVRYSYYINILANFGFFLGSSTGIIKDIDNFGDLTQQYAFSLPTVSAGLSYSFNDFFRINMGTEYGAVYYPEMTVYTQTGLAKSLSPVMEFFSFFGGTDLFFSKNRALSILVGWKRQYKQPLGDNKNSVYLNTLDIQNDTIYTQIGLNLQIDELSTALKKVIPMK